MDKYSWVMYHAYKYNIMSEKKAAKHSKNILYMETQ